MNEIGAVLPIEPAQSGEAPGRVTLAQGSGQDIPAVQTPDGAFGSMLSEAISGLDDKVAEADRMVAQFAINQNTPIHHVTIALEEARLAVELATRVRQGLTEGYREIMNMQL